MAKEAFLINPPHRLPKRKSGVVKTHRILAFEGKNGVIHTSGGAKIVRPGLRINPFRSFKSPFKHNPLFGEELMFIGSNPRKRGEKMSHKRHKRFHHNPKRKRGHRRFRRNPVAAVMGGLSSFTNKSSLMMIAGAGIGAVASRMLPNFLKLDGWKAIAAQVGILSVGSMVVGKFLGGDAGKGVMAGSGAILITDTVRNVLSTSAAAAGATVQGYEGVSGPPAAVPAEPYVDPYGSQAYGFSGYEGMY